MNEVIKTIRFTIYTTQIQLVVEPIYITHQPKPEQIKQTKKYIEKREIERKQK